MEPQGQRSKLLLSAYCKSLDGSMGLTNGARETLDTLLFGTRIPRAPQAIDSQRANEARALSKLLKPGGCILGMAGEFHMMRVFQNKQHY